jgi:hypothetical protein
MNTQNRRLLVCFLIFIGLIGTPGKVFSQQATADKVPAAAIKGTGSTRQMSREETLVRSTYDKLVTYHKAARLRAARNNALVDDASGPEFVLRDFRSGPIREILLTKYADVVTPPSGEIIQLAHGIIREEGEAEEATFEMTWIQGQYSSIFDRQWTISDLLAIESPKYSDVGQYVSYEVTVLFEDQSRTYRAMVVFHNAYGTAYQTTESPKPEFWDTIVGMGGTLTRLWEETRPPSSRKTVPQDRTAALSDLRTDLLKTVGASFANRQYSHSAGPFGGRTRVAGSLTPGTEVMPVPPIPDYYLWFSSSDVEHLSGDHFGTAHFTPSCTSVNNTTQHCGVDLSLVGADDGGTLDTILYSHVGVKKDLSGGATGPKGSSISCRGGRGCSFLQLHLCKL